MKKDALEQFLEEKKQTNEKKFAKFDRAARLKQWKDQVASLYREIEEYLETAINKGIVGVEKKKISLTEEYLGNYEIQQLNINVGGERVIITPRGTLILGAFGRCDMNGEGDTIMLVLLTPGAKPDIRITEQLQSRGKTGMEKSKATISDAQWYFASQGPRWEYSPLSKETFTEALQAVMRK